MLKFKLSSIWRMVKLLTNKIFISFRCPSDETILKRDMQNCNIIFDTNTYRYIVKEKSEVESLKAIDRLIKLEKKRNIEAYFSPIVAIELQTHLAEPTYGGYNQCKNSLILQYKHCLNTNNFPRIAKYSDIHFCKMLFDIYPVSIEREQAKIINLSRNIYKDYSPLNLSSNFQNFCESKKLNEEFEKRFLNDLYKWHKTLYSLDENLKQNHIEIERIKRELNSDTPTQKIALSIIRRISNLYNAEIDKFGPKFLVNEDLKKLKINFDNLNEETVKEKIKIITEKNPTYLIFYLNLIKKIAGNKGYNLQQLKNGYKNEKGNYFWDLEIVFHIDFKYNNKETFIITSDGEFEEAAKLTQKDYKVLNIEEYLKIIKF